MRIIPKPEGNCWHATLQGPIDVVILVGRRWIVLWPPNVEVIIRISIAVKIKHPRSVLGDIFFLGVIPIGTRPLISRCLREHGIRLELVLKLPSVTNLRPGIEIILPISCEGNTRSKCSWSSPLAWRFIAHLNKKKVLGTYTSLITVTNFSTGPPPGLVSFVFLKDWHHQGSKRWILMGGLFWEKFSQFWNFSLWRIFFYRRQKYESVYST